jgi:hypothetical protein
VNLLIFGLGERLGDPKAEGRLLRALRRRSPAADADLPQDFLPFADIIPMAMFKRPDDRRCAVKTSRCLSSHSIILNQCFV